MNFHIDHKYLKHNNMNKTVQNKEMEIHAIPKKKVYLWFAIFFIAASVCIFGFQQYYSHQFNDKLCDVIFEMGYSPDTTANRSGSQADYQAYAKAVNQVQQGQTEDAIPTLKQLYQNASAEERIEYGTCLAYAYLKNYDYKKASVLVATLIRLAKSLYGEPTDDLVFLQKALSDKFFT